MKGEFSCLSVNFWVSIFLWLNPVVSLSQYMSQKWAARVWGENRLLSVVTNTPDFFKKDYPINQWKIRKITRRGGGETPNQLIFYHKIISRGEIANIWPEEYFLAQSFIEWSRKNHTNVLNFRHSNNKGSGNK